MESARHASHTSCSIAGSVTTVEMLRSRVDTAKHDASARHEATGRYDAAS